MYLWFKKDSTFFVIYEIQNIIYGRIKLFDPIANCYLEYSETYKRNIQFHKKTACILIVCTRKLKNITQNYLWHLERRLLHLSVINEWLFQAKQSQDKVDSRIRILKQHGKQRENILNLIYPQLSIWELYVLHVPQRLKQWYKGLSTLINRFLNQSLPIWKFCKHSMRFISFNIRCLQCVYTWLNCLDSCVQQKSIFNVLHVWWF